MQNAKDQSENTDSEQLASLEKNIEQLLSEDQPSNDITNTSETSSEQTEESTSLKESYPSTQLLQQASDLQISTETSPDNLKSGEVPSETNPSRPQQEVKKKTKEEFIAENREAANQLNLAFNIRKDSYDSPALNPMHKSSVDSLYLVSRMASTMNRFTEETSPTTAQELSRNINWLGVVEDMLSFSILDWGNLQVRFKDHYHLIKSEVASREAIMKDINKLNNDYNNTHLKIKESKDRINKKFQNEDWKEEEITKVILDDHAIGFGDAYTFIKGLLFAIYENPLILVTIVKHNSESYKLRVLEDTLCNHFYEDLLLDAKYDVGLIRLLAELLKIEFERAEKFTDLYTTGNFSDRMMSSYVRRNECIKFAKTLLKNSLMLIAYERELLAINNIKEMEAALARKMKSSSRSDRSSHTLAPTTLMSTKSEIVRPSFLPEGKQQTSAPNRSNRQRTSTITVYAELFRDSAEGSAQANQKEEGTPTHPTRSTHHHSTYHAHSLSQSTRTESQSVKSTRSNSGSRKEEVKETTRETGRGRGWRNGIDVNKLIGRRDSTALPSFIGRSKRNRDNTTSQSEVPIDPEKSFELVVDESRTPKSQPPMEYTNEYFEKDPELKRLYQERLAKLQAFVSSLITSIFENVYNMPTGLRIVCKIMLKLSKSKFPNLTRKEYHNILGNFLFAKWIIPFFLSPEHYGIVDDFQKKDVINNNLMEVSKVLKRVFFQDYYSKDDILCPLNWFIKQLNPSIEEFYTEVCDVNDQIIEDILSGKNISQGKDRITSRSITISVYEIQLLVENITKFSKEVGEVSKSAVKHAESIKYYNEQSPIFVDKIDPATKQKLKTTQAYVNFFDLVVPPRLSGHYLEEFNRIQNYQKDMSESEKLLAKSKYLLKQVLINIEDLRNLSKMSASKDLNIEEVLEKYQEKLYANEVKVNTQKEKAPVHISARFLLTNIRKLEKLYRENNYQKMYNEMVTEFKDMIYTLNENIVEAKLQLLKGLDTVTKNYLALKDLHEKKKKAIKKTVVREFIQTVRISLCITSPVTRKCFATPQANPNQRGMSRSSILQPVQHESLSSPKIVILKQKDCIHERFAFMKELTSNLASLATLQDQHSGPMKLDSQLLKGKRGSTMNAMGEDYFNEKSSHCTTINEFIEVFGSIPEVQESIKEFIDSGGNSDKYGVNEAFSLYLDSIFDLVKKMFQNLTEEEYKMIMDEIECYITKRLYPKVFPSQETYNDQAFLARVRTLEWVNFDYLEIPEKNRCPEMWEYAAKLFSQIDNKWTPLEKLDCMIECFKCIVQVSGLASTKESSAGADETLPILIYVLLKAAPKRMYSNLNFISAFRHSGKLLSEAGFCLTNFKSVTSFIESLDYRSLKMNQTDYDKKIYEYEVKYQIHFMKTRTRSERQPINLKEFRSTIDVQKLRKEILEES